MQLSRTFGAHSTASVAVMLIQAGLGRPVGGAPGGGADPRDAADVDDDAAVGLRLEDGVGGLGAVERGEQVEGDDRGDEERGRGVGGQERVRRPAGVVDQDVEAPVAIWSTAAVTSACGPGPPGGRRPATKWADRVAPPASRRVRRSSSGAWRPQVTTSAPAPRSARTIAARPKPRGCRRSRTATRPVKSSIGTRTAGPAAGPLALSWFASPTGRHPLAPALRRPRRPRANTSGQGEC